MVQGQQGGTGTPGSGDRDTRVAQGPWGGRIGTLGWGDRDPAVKGQGLQGGIGTPGSGDPGMEGQGHRGGTGIRGWHKDPGMEGLGRQGQGIVTPGWDGDSGMEGQEHQGGTGSLASGHSPRGGGTVTLAWRQGPRGGGTAPGVAAPCAPCQDQEIPELVPCRGHPGAEEQTGPVTGGDIGGPVMPPQPGLSLSQGQEPCGDPKSLSQPHSRRAPWHRWVPAPPGLLGIIPCPHGTSPDKDKVSPTTPHLFQMDGAS